MSPAKYIVRTSYLLQKSNVAIYVEQKVNGNHFTSKSVKTNNFRKEDCHNNE